MNIREYGDFLQDILDSIDYIENFLTGCEADDFITIRGPSSPYSGVCMSWERLQSTYPSK